MKVTFTKSGERRYGVYVERDRAPALWLDPAPGYDPDVPHDLLHFLAEAELGLDDGVFGDLARGGNARIFRPVDKTLVAKMWRKQRIRKTRLPEGRRSEQLAGRLQHAWKTQSPDPELAPVLAKLATLAEEWRALPLQGRMTLEWPRPERRG